MSVTSRAATLMPSRHRDRLRWLLSFLRHDHMYHEVEHRREFMRRAFTAQKFNGITGDYVEFGCWGGTTFALAYRESRRRALSCTLWAFDSFQGLPPQALPADDHPRWQAGALSTSLGEFRAICRRNGIPDDDYRVVAGYYEETIGSAASYAGELPSDIAVAYVDCDLYSSTTTVLGFLAPRLKHGMIVAFDDYFCYSSTALAGERKALADFAHSHPRFHFSPYAQFGWHGMSFVVEDRALLEAP